MAEVEFGGRVRALVPPRRVFAEIDARLAPIRAFAVLPVEAQFGPGTGIGTGLPALDDYDGTSVVGRLWNIVDWFAYLAVPDAQRMFELRARLTATQRGNRAALAVLRYHLEHGRFPSGIADALSPEPLEPFTNRPFIFRLTESGFLLYAAASDRDDDGGVHHGRYGEPSDREAAAGRVGPDGDYVFWPLPPPDDTDRLQFRAYRESQAREAAEEARYEAELRAAERSGEVTDDPGGG